MKYNVDKRMNNRNHNNLSKNGDILHVPILRSINNNREKMTLNSLIKFIDSNKKYILNPDATQFNSNDYVDVKINDIDNNMPIYDVYQKLNHLRPFQVEKLSIGDMFNADKYNIIRVGILSELNGKNMSLYVSIMSLLLPDFTQKNPDDQYSYINNLLSFAKSNLNDYMNNNKYLKWNKKDIIEYLDSFVCNVHIIKYIANIIHVNIFIVSDGEITLYDDKFIKYKKNLFLIEIDGSYEPIHFGIVKHLAHNSELMSAMLSPLYTKNINMYESNMENKCTVSESLEELNKYYVKDVKLDYKNKILLNRMQRSTQANTNIEPVPTCIVGEIENDKFEEVMDFEDCDANDMESHTKNDGLDEEKYDIKDMEKKKLVELKEIAEKIGISSSITVKNKLKLKKKIDLINEINAKMNLQV